MATLKVCHITTVHKPFDDRIFHKECKTLVKAGYEVFLIAPHNKNLIIDGVKIIALPAVKTRLRRFFLLTLKAFHTALKLKADIYHFHDPELLPVGMMLKLLTRAKVIYDVHEDTPRQILSKGYIPKRLRTIISKIFETLENFSAIKFDYLVTATPFIRNRFQKMGCKAIDVQNMPLLSEFTNIKHDWSAKEKAVCYIGGINKIRGLCEMVKAMNLLQDVKLYIAGPVERKEDESIIANSKNVKYLGNLKRDEIKNLFRKVIAGLVLFHPEDNHINAQPVKLFEYMSAGIPVIASNFYLWKEIVQSNHCGLCVNPLNPKEIAEGIQYLLTHQTEAQKMGENGRKIILEKNNWEKESEKLLKIYNDL
ncbi:MAG: glycosyltransferase family 4 protein [Cytophagaceae bacterium]